MVLQRHLFYWSIANLVILGGSLLMPWDCFCFHPFDKPVSGLRFIPIKIASGTQLLLEHGFSWLWLLSFLEGVSGIFVIDYIIFNIIKIVKRKIYTGSKIISFILAIVILLFLLGAIYHLGWPFLGIWFCMLGLFSSMILEWRNSTFTNVILGD